MVLSESGVDGAGHLTDRIGNVFTLLSFLFAGFWTKEENARKD
jgi:hypothetical protein